MKKKYVQYGSGTKSIPGWISFDASPTLLIQRLPIIGRLLRKRLNCIFDEEIKYGDIVKGLPIADESVDVVFCSHILEHLALEDFFKALRNTFRILKPGGIFRVVVPNLRLDIEEYWATYTSKDGYNASFNFLKNSCIGQEKRPKDLKSLISEIVGNSRHRWMWDEKSLEKALSSEGFVDVKPFKRGEMGKPPDKKIILPEKEHQFKRGFGLQCIRPL